MAGKLNAQNTLGDALQMCCMAVLEKVSRTIPDSKVEPNGQSAAKMLTPASIGYSYIYVGFLPNGDLQVLSHGALASGRPAALVGSIKLGRAVGLTVKALASKIITKLEN